MIIHENISDFLIVASMTRKKKKKTKNLCQSKLGYDTKKNKERTRYILKTYKS